MDFKNRIFCRDSVSRIFRLFLCLMLCVCIIFSASVLRPVDVNASATMAVVGVTVVAAALCALGIGVYSIVTNNNYNDMCTEVWNNLTEPIKQQITMYAASGAVFACLSREALSAIGNAFTQLFNSSTISGYNSTIAAQTALGDLSGSANLAAAFGCTDYYNNPGASQVYYGAKVIDNYCSYLDADRENYVHVAGYTDFTDTGYANYTVRVNGHGLTSGYTYGSAYNSTLMETIQCNKFLYLLTYYDNAEKTQQRYMLCTAVKSGEDWKLRTFSERLYGSSADVINPANERFWSDGFSVVDHGIDDVVGRIGDRVGDASGNVTLPIPGTADSVGTPADIRSETQAQILGKDITADDTTSSETSSSSSDSSSSSSPSDTINNAPGLPEIIFKDKFPFCLPWDIYSIFSVLQAEPVAPKFVWPIKLERLGVDQSITIDFSQFEDVAKICRYFEGAIFILALILLSRKIIGA